MRAKALLVICATLTILVRTAVLAAPFMNFPAKPSMQVSSSVKAALTQVWMSLIIIAKFDPPPPPLISWFISAMDFLSSSTESLSSSTQSRMAPASRRVIPAARESVAMSAEVERAESRLTERAAWARSFGSFLMAVAWLER
ncbi:hypothetical protein MIMGU_mgv1a015918mg [Erythranthe guttata]|uniref:Uncharacterized protein n=1 Tax=Erythranthe guttata TaxID=4155 RepID=A0A022QCL6_ERYGU|nr:hypothetical protein MIMGU_mgv1a015918mg [Erythranthe guttata]